ncbi:MAG: UvrD-helicase domain-containing protein, partial [Clostridia bacterium]|nr:UvrD-helicase domain-containing protein [Clostridia bacterium]
MAEKKAIEWKPRQKMALEARGVSLAVSAAAGSGKTAVLTERIVRLLSEGFCSASELCVVTFTKAAAGELQDRLYEKLSEAVSRGEGDKKRLARQLFALDRAHISTIDSFCLDLIRAYRRELGLRPGVRVCEETEEDALFREACREGLEAYLSDPKDKEKKDLIYSRFCTAKKQDALWSVLKSMQAKAGNLPEGTGFFRLKLMETAREWQAVRNGEKRLTETAAGAFAVKRAEEVLTRADQALEALFAEMERAPGVAAKREAFYRERQTLLRAALSEVRAGDLPR